MIKKNGFTLLELLIVIIIIGILAGIALPQYVSTIEKARSTEAIVNVGSLRSSLSRYWYERGIITTDLSKLDIDNPNEVVDKFYTYRIVDNETNSVTRKYTIYAERTVGIQSYWVKWIQRSNKEGKLYKSNNLGGPSE